MPKRKATTVSVDEDLLGRAREILGTQSDTATVAAALDWIVFRDEVCRGIRAMAGSNSLRDIYADED
jgi:Arc/MetJ family transcription regulator